jgi:hypothetical protein
LKRGRNLPLLNQGIAMKRIILVLTIFIAARSWGQTAAQSINTPFANARPLNLLTSQLGRRGFGNHKFHLPRGYGFFDRSGTSSNLHISYPD